LGRLRCKNLITIWRAATPLGRACFARSASNADPVSKAAIASCAAHHNVAGIAPPKQHRHKASIVRPNNRGPTLRSGLLRAPKLFLTNEFPRIVNKFWGKVQNGSQAAPRFACFALGRQQKTGELLVYYDWPSFPPTRTAMRGVISVFSLSAAVSQPASFRGK